MQWAQKLLSTRSGTLILAAAAAVIAAIIFLVYLNRYRESLNESSASATVLVAKSLIPKGTPGESVAAQGMFQVVETTKGQLLDGALVDPSLLKGKVAAADIFPGHQLTAADFAVSDVASFGATLVGDQRAIAVPLDSAHGMLGRVQPGDHVDVYAGFNIQRVDHNGVPIGGGQGDPVLRQIMEDVNVLAVPGSSSGGIGATKGSNIVLQATPDQATKLAFAADHGEIWIVLRPRSGGKGEAPDLVTAETIILNVPPVRVYHWYGGRR